MVAIIQQGIFIRTDINNASGIAQRKCRITAPSFNRGIIRRALNLQHSIIERSRVYRATHLNNLITII